MQFRKDEVIECARKAADACGFEIYEIVVQLRKGSVRVDVKIDNGSLISHDDCSRYTRELTSQIDSTLQMENYVLEVSSPGLKRKIRNYGEYIRFLKSPVKVVLVEGRVVMGMLEKVEDGTLTIIDNKKEQIVSIESVKYANLDY